MRSSAIGLERVPPLIAFGRNLLICRLKSGKKERAEFGKTPLYAEIEAWMMTALAAIATKDALVMGCDSLASTSKAFLDPLAVLKYFDPDNDYGVKVDDNGKPILKTFHQVYREAHPIAYRSLTHAEKLFSLDPVPLGVMASGICSIGDLSIKTIIEQYREKVLPKLMGLSTAPSSVEAAAKSFQDFLNGFYQKEFKELQPKPYLEVLIGGYGDKEDHPLVYRIYVHENEMRRPLNGYGVVLGSQMPEVQRLVFGTDPFNKQIITERHKDLMFRYKREVDEILNLNNIEYAIPNPSENVSEFFAEDWDLQPFGAEYADFSEKNAVECVKFFIETMIRSQQFSSNPPAAGGELHIGVITKAGGFRFVDPG